MKHNLETLKKNFTIEELAEIEKELREMLTYLEAHKMFGERFFEEIIIKEILGEDS